MSRHPDPDRLQEYLADLLCREERAELEAHLAACAECTGEVVRERALSRALATLPRSIAPGRDLLAGINAAIDAGQTAPLEPHPGSGRRSIAAPRFALAAAALLLIALSALVTMLLVQPRDQRPLARGAGPEPAGQATNPVVREVLATEPSYAAAAAELERALAAGRGRLDPGTVRLIDANLRVVEQALAEARAALHRDPNNASVAELLQHAQEQKLALLRRATRAGT